MGSEQKIRLIGGTLHGREIWLEGGQLTLGEHGCDLCIPLNGDGQVVLSLKDGQMFVDAGGATVRVNGRRHKTSLPLPAEGVLQTMGLAMAFGSHEANLSHYRLHTGFSAIYWGIVLTFFILVGGIAVIWSSPSAKPPPSITAQVDTLLRQEGLTQTVARWDQDGTLQLSGYCQNSAVLQNARLKLESWGVLYRDSVVCTDQLIRNVSDILTQAGYANAQVTSSVPGEVHITADITMGKRWSIVQPQLAEVPGLKHWKIDNPYEAEDKAIIDKVLQNGLAGNLSVTPVGQSFVISGVLDIEQQQVLNRVLAQLREQFPGIALSYQNVSASNEGSQHFPSPVAAIVHSRQGIYLILEDGERLRVESLLPDGSEVVELNDRAVTLKYQGALINFPLNF